MPISRSARSLVITVMALVGCESEPTNCPVGSDCNLLSDTASMAPGVGAEWEQQDGAELPQLDDTDEPGTPPALRDDDNDGWTPALGDCNDNNAAVHPNASEACDGVDNDCNGLVDDGLGHQLIQESDYGADGIPEIITYTLYDVSGKLAGRQTDSDVDGIIDSSES